MNTFSVLVTQTYPRLWSYENDDKHAFANLDCLFTNLRLACVEINNGIKMGIGNSGHNVKLDTTNRGY